MYSCIRSSDSFNRFKVKGNPQLQILVLTFKTPSGTFTLILLQLSTLSFYLLVDFTHTSIDSIMSDEYYEQYGFKESEWARAQNFMLSGCVGVVGVIVTSIFCYLAGRRLTVVLELLLCVVALVLTISMPSMPVVLTTSSYAIR